jgi:hypothetical protein
MYSYVNSIIVVKATRLTQPVSSAHIYPNNEYIRL